MLDFSSVQQRGMGRAMLVAQGGEPPPHVYVIDPLVQQLSSEDYCAGNGAMLTPSEAQGMAGLLQQMAMAMDHNEAQRGVAAAETEAAMEAVNDLSYQLARVQLIHRGLFVGAGVLALLASQAFIAWLV